MPNIHAKDLKCIIIVLFCQKQVYKMKEILRKKDEKQIIIGDPIIRGNNVRL